jgi:hypothetical protein
MTPLGAEALGEGGLGAEAPGRRRLTRRSLLAGAATLQAQPAASLDLFLLAGQSNMAGRGVIEDEDARPIPGVFAQARDLAWKPAVDPIHYDKPIAAVCLGRSFARTLLKSEPNRAIGLIPAAMGGSSLDEWIPGGAFFAEAVRRARAAAPSGALRGILWHQGESDAGQEERARTYTDRWLAVMTALRRELGVPDLPIVVGQLGRFLGDKYPFARSINSQLAALPLRDNRAAFVSSSGLSHKGDELHFDAAGLREFGRRYALAWMSLASWWGA